MTAVPDPTTIGGLVREAIRRLFADEAIPLAGNIAFRAVFSLFPFLIFLTAMAGFFGSEDLAEKAVNFLLGVAPEALVRPLAGEIRSILTVPRADLLSLAALLTIWSAMAGVDSVRVGLNRAYDMREVRPTWRLYLIEVLFVIASAIGLLAFSFLIILFPLAMKFAASHGFDLAGRFTTFDQLRQPAALLLLFIGVYAAHRTLPARPLPWRKVLPGVLITVLVWAGLAVGFSWWLLHFNSFASTYASLSGLFAVTFFVYLAALVLIFGGELNRVLDLVDSKPSANETPDFGAQ